MNGALTRTGGEGTCVGKPQVDPALSLALIGSASAEKRRGGTQTPGRGAFDKGDLKEAAGGADDYGAASLFGWACVGPTGLGDDEEAAHGRPKRGGQLAVGGSES
jgi:hypothetical protein